MTTIPPTSAGVPLAEVGRIAYAVAVGTGAELAA